MATNRNEVMAATLAGITSNYKPRLAGEPSLTRILTMKFSDEHTGIEAGAPAFDVPVTWVRRPHWFGHALLVLVCCATILPQAAAQQSRLADEQYARGRLGPSFAPPDLPTQESINDAERRARQKEERRMRWLKQSNEFLPESATSREMGSRANLSGDSPDGRPRPRMNGLSQEERHRLRIEIREAGYSAYAPEGGRPGRPDGR